MSSLITFVSAITVAGLVVALYLLPWLIAAGRDHHQRSAICLLTLLLGWTGLGWIVALIWATTAVRPRAESR